MPAKAPKTAARVTEKLAILGQQIRDHRKAIRVTAAATAEAAGISRVTLHRIEKGEPSVTMGAYLNVMDALALEYVPAEKVAIDPGQANDRFRDMIPARIRLADYPQLKKLAWQVHGTDTLTPLEALSIYERNRRYMDTDNLSEQEQQLIEALRLGLGGIAKPDANVQA